MTQEVNTENVDKNENTNINDQNDQAEGQDDNLQQTFDRDYVEQLRKESAQRRVKAKELEDELQSLREKEREREEAELAEQKRFEELAQQYKSELEDMKSEIKKQRIENLRSNIANELGIPASLAARLKGETEEEIRADAEFIAKDITPPAPEKTQTQQKRAYATQAVPSGNASGETIEQKRARLYGARNIFTR